MAEADRLENLRPTVGRHGGNPHLRHDFEDALAQGFDDVLDGGLRGGVTQQTLRGQRLYGLSRHVRVDRDSAVTDEEGDVVDLAGVPRLDDEADLGAGLLAEQMVVQGRSRQKRRNRGHFRVGFAVRQDQERHALGNRAVRFSEEVFEGGLQFRSTPGRAVQAAQRPRREPFPGARGADVLDLRQLVRINDWEVNRQLARVAAGVLQQVRLGTRGGCKRGHQFLANRVEGRVRDLGKQLREVVKK